MTGPLRGLQLDFWTSPEIETGLSHHQPRDAASYARGDGRPAAKSTSVRRESADHSANVQLTAPAAIGLPDWLPRDAWAAYLAMRDELDAPLSERVIARAIGSLTRLREAGHDPAGVLNQSVVRRARSFSAVMCLSLPVVGDFALPDSS